jgi:tetratricopeptide (TPR) repeat protein
MKKSGQLSQDDAKRTLLAAEDAFKTANELDPDNPKLMSDLAALYIQSAHLQTAIEDRVPFYDHSIEWWTKAADAAARQPQERDQYLEEAGKTYYEKANELFAAKQYSEADQAAKEGMGVTPQQSVTYRQLSKLDYDISQYRQ